MYIEREFHDYRDHHRRPSVGPRVYRTSPTLVIVIFMCGLGLALAVLG